ncbi:MAG: glycosyltransferase family 2 protein [Pirellulales bacterium]|nr:glycosyltransferase family 2 protein [Pirellulales bacterium]
MDEVKPSISFFFPVYNDERTIVQLTQRARQVLLDVAQDFEIVIINDGSRDRSGQVADELAAKYPEVIVVHHQGNQGYGRAIQTGFARANRYEWVCFTDGDFQYDPGELYHIAKLLPHYDVVAGFRFRKVYGPLRVLMSAGLNWGVRLLYGTRYRDITCGLKLVRRSVLDELQIKSTSGFVGAELVLRAALAGYRIGEVGISTYDREFGDSAAVSWQNIKTTFRDLMQLRKEVFQNRPRANDVGSLAADHCSSGTVTAENASESSRSAQL